MKLLPIPGAPGYRIDCENQVAYRVNGYLWKVNSRTKYKVINLYVNGKEIVTTVFRLMYCAQNGIDITKIPKGVVIAMRNGKATAITRQEVARKRSITIRTMKRKKETWQRNTNLINQFFNGNKKPLLSELQNIEKSVKFWFIETYGLNAERAEIVAAYGVNRYLERLRDGCPSPFIFGSVVRYGRGENARISKQRDFTDDMQTIVI